MPEKIIIKLDKIEERDVDFVVMQAFTQPWFQDIFLAYTEWVGAEVIYIEHSLTDPQYGESDITVIVDKDGARYGLLIENKIDAQAMQEQYMRYCRRGEIGINNNDYEAFSVFLIAPQAYLDSNNEAKMYPNRIAYEVLRDAFTQHGEIFSAAVLKRAVEKQAAGYTVQEVPSITEFWENLYCHCKTRGIDMYQAKGAKGSRSTWPQFRVPLKGTALYFKAKYGFVDLQFTGKQKERARVIQDLSKLREPDMHWEDTGNSLSLRIRVLPIDLTEIFDAHINEVTIMLAAVERLTDFATMLNDIGYIV